MSKVILENGVPFVAASKVSVFGTAGTNDIVKVLDFAGTEVTSDASIERVEFARPSTGYTYKATSTGVQVLLNGTVVTNLVNGQKLAFTDGSATVATEFNPATASVVVKLGGVVVPTTAGAVAFTPDNTAGEASTITTGSGGTGSTAGQSFSLTATAETKTLTGGNDTVDGATVVDSISGDTVIDSSTTDSDVLNIASTGAINPASVINIETVNATAKYGSITVDASKYIGVKTLNLASSIAAGSAEVQNVAASSVAAVVAGDKVAALTVSSSTSGGTITVDAGKATTVTLTGNTGTDAFALTLNGGSTTVKGNVANESTTITSKGSANTVTVDTALATATTGAVTIKGNQALTLSATSAQLTGLTVTDATDAGIQTTTKITTTGAGNDLSKVATDSIEFTTTGAHTIKFGNNANVKLSLDATGAANKLTLQSTATTDTLNLSVNSSTATVESDATTYFKTVNLSADQATTVTGTFGANTSVNVTGSKDVTFAATSTAKTVDASALTGKLTVLGAGIANMTKVIGSAQADTITFGTIAAATTVSAGAGDDVIKLGAVADFALTIDGGTGSNTLQLSADSNLTDNTSDKTSVITNINTVDLNGFDLTVTQKQGFTLGNTFAVKGTAAADIFTVKVVDNAGSAFVDLSGVSLSGSGTLKIDASTSTATNTLTGAAAATTIIGSAQADIITGGAGADTIYGKAGADKLTGGAGADNFRLGAKADWTTSANVKHITDFVAGTDKLAFVVDDSAGANVTGDLSAAEAFLKGVTIGATSTVKAMSQMISSTVAANSISDVYTQLGTLLTAETFIASTAAAGANQLIARVVEFTTGSAAGKYLVLNDATAGFAETDDIVINITGVTGTVSATDFSFAAA